MAWTWHFYIACAVIAAAVFFSLPGGKNRFRFLGLKRKPDLSPLHFCMIGVFLSAVVLLLPVYLQDLAEEADHSVRAVISSLHQAFQMFTLDADREIILKLSVEKDWQSRCAYWILSGELILAPLLTFAFVVSFFEDFLGALRWRMSLARDVYVFSELNDRSLALAKSIVQKKGRGALLMFSNARGSEDDRAAALAAQAREYRAILWKKDMLSIHLDGRGKRKNLYLFAIGEDETANHTLALRLIDRYRNRKKTWLYVFSSRVEGELLLNQKDTGRMTVRLIDTAQSLIYHHLYREGGMLFKAADEAQPAQPGEPLDLHCLVIGLGRYGTEMLKALAWFGQMPGYRLTIDVYDMDEHAAERFAAKCPELMDEAHNRADIAGDAAYRISIHAGVDVTLPDFEKELRQMNGVCYAFIALGSDAMNISASVALRTVFAGINGKDSRLPVIEAIVSQADQAEALNAAAGENKGISDYESTPYNIRFIGSMDDLYSVDTILQSESEKKAEKYHTHWAKTSEEKESGKRKLYRYGFYYRSSYSAVIHAKALAGVLRDRGVTAGQLSERKAELNCLEHRRWNAYMRSEGYRYAETTNRLAKLHRSLVPFDRLPAEDADKDDYLAFIKDLLSQQSKG